MKGQRTYWHLQHLGRRPSAYEIATSHLLYYPQRGFEVETTVSGWVDKFQRFSPLGCSCWDGFHDPRETTYASYTALQANREVFVEGLLGAAEGGTYDQALSADWVRWSEDVLPVLRFPVHGLQMVAAYVAGLAPGSRVLVAALFQAADELRRVHTLARRQAQLARRTPEYGSGSREGWMRAPFWQPWRSLLERLLVTYDWGEALVALNLVVKPAFDELFLVHLGRIARQRGDDLLERLLQTLAEDASWHRSWTEAFLRYVLADHPENRPVVELWLTEWGPALHAALAPLDEWPDGTAIRKSVEGRVGRFQQDILAHG